MFLLAVVFVLLFVFVFLQSLLQSMEVLDDSQLLQVEAGFEKTISSQWISASFFFLAVLFVFFDMELLLLISSILYVNMTGVFLFSWLLVMAFILMTLVLEWKYLGLKWSY